MPWALHSDVGYMMPVLCPVTGSHTAYQVMGIYHHEPCGKLHVESFPVPHFMICRISNRDIVWGEDPMVN